MQTTCPCSHITIVRCRRKRHKLAETSVKVGLKISKLKTKVFRINTTTRQAVVERQQLEEVEKFTYLGSIVYCFGRTDKAQRGISYIQERLLFALVNIGIHWTDKLTTNEDLWKLLGEEPVVLQIRRRK